MGHTVYGIDIVDGNDLLTYEEWHDNIDLVIHLAGRSGVRESIKDPSAYWMNNIEASRRLFNQYPDTRILYASSSSAYEPDLNPYAASKYILDELAKRHKNILGMRFHTVYSDVCPRDTMFFYKLMNGKLEYTTNHYRDFIHLNDVLDAIELLIANPNINGLVDIGTGNPVSIRDLAPELPVRLHTPGEREFTCANTEIMKSIGFEPKYSVDDFLTNSVVFDKI